MESKPNHHKTHQTALAARHFTRNWTWIVLTVASLVMVPAARAAEVDDAALNSGLQLVGNLLAAILGRWVWNVAFWGIAWVQLLACAGTLVVVGIVAQGMRWLMRRTLKSLPSREAEASAKSRGAPWARLALEAVLPPLTLLVWAWGVYAALTILFVRPVFELVFLATLARWLKNAGSVIALFWFLFRMIRVVELELHRWTAGTDSKWDDVLVAVVVRAIRLIIPLLAVIFVVPALNLSVTSHEFFKQAASLLLIGAIGFILFQLVNAVEEAVLAQFRIDVKDNLEARKVYTQVKVLKKIAIVVIILFTTASMLMVFDSVRQLGTSILASAGVAGIIVGFAAQRSIATVLAGFQIAMTQPIRLDDVVIVENEWGRIEEITLTYVVVLIWDQRRLIVPINYFIEKPFQNWTRISADLLGTIYLYTDYTVPVQALREELDRVLAGTKLWDGRVKGIQVTDSKENVLEVRVLVSAADASAAWDLRCLVREKLVDFLQRTHPDSLPRTRAELSHGQPAGPVAKS